MKANQDKYSPIVGKYDQNDVSASCSSWNQKQQLWKTNKEQKYIVDASLWIYF